MVSTSVQPELGTGLAGVAEKADVLLPQLIVHVRVVDDLPGEEDALYRKALAGLVGVVDRPIDAVAEAEFPGEVDRETPGRVAVALFLDLGDQGRVVAGRQHACDLVFEVEALPEDQRRHQPLNSPSILRLNPAISGLMDPALT